MSISAESVFETVVESKIAITTMLLSEGLSWAAYKSDSTRLLLNCKMENCGFHIRVAYSKEAGKAIVVVWVPHSCPLDTHFGFRGR